MKVYTLISSQNKKVKNFFLKTVKKLMGEGLIQIEMVAPTSARSPKDHSKFFHEANPK